MPKFYLLLTILYTEQGKGQGVSKTVNMIGAEIDITFGFFAIDH